MADKWNWDTTGDEVVAEYAEQIKGKTVLITGAGSGGLGGESAIAIAKAQPKLIILHARSEDRIAEIAKSVNELGVPTKNLLVELTSFAAVRKGAQEVISWDDITIDVLIHSAGVMTTPWGKTDDGFELQFGINHLALFLFTNLLLKAGKITDGGRIVNVTSLGYVMSPIRWDDYNFQDGATYDKGLGYGQSKTANVLYAEGLANRLKSKGITAFSAHPGVVMTNLGRHLTPEEIEKILELGKQKAYGDDFNGDFKTLNQGAACQITAAFSPLIVDQNGGLLVDSTIKERVEHGRGAENADRLWKLSEELVGEEFDF